MAITTTPQLIVRPPQYVEESTEGTTPTSSPSFTICGVPKSLSFKINGNFFDVTQLGDEDLVTHAQGQQEYESTLVFTLVSSTFLKYGVNDANYATPTGTVSKSLSILFSYYLNGTENFVILKGSRVKDCSINMEVGKEIEVTFNMIHTSISTPSSSHGLTTPTLVSTASGSVWDWIAGGTTPVSWNSVAQDCKKIKIDINRNTKADHTLGNLDPHSSQPHGRRITGSFTVLHTATTLETDFKAGTARTLAVVLKSATSTLTISNAKLRSFSTEFVDEDTIVEDYDYGALTCTVT